jgi:hypothetical protein
MIVYSLRCSNDHAFDEWFASSAYYDTQKKKNKLVCPICGDKNVTKGLMAPNVGKSAAAPAPSCGAPSCSNGACPMSGVK